MPLLRLQLHGIQSNFVKALDLACFPRLRDHRRQYDNYGIVPDRHIGSNDPYLTRAETSCYAEWIEVMPRLNWRPWGNVSVFHFSLSAH